VIERVKKMHNNLTTTMLLVLTEGGHPPQTTFVLTRLAFIKQYTKDTHITSKKRKRGRGGRKNDADFITLSSYTSN